MDIWCFGVIIFYLYTEGRLPYGIPQNYQFLDEKTLNNI